MDPNPYMGKSADELEAIQQANMATRDKLRAEMLLVRKALDAAHDAERARARLAGLSRGELETIAVAARAELAATAQDQGQG